MAQSKIRYEAGAQTSASSFRLLFLFIAAALVVYAPTLFSFFQADDFELLWLVRERGPFGLWSHDSIFFRPLISLSLYVNNLISGLSPWSHHLANTAVHGLCAFIVYQIGSLLFVERRLALISGALFLVLPVHVEAVSWISGRTDVFAASGGLAAFWAYLKYSQSGRSRWLVLSILFFWVSLLCKESVVTLPLIILVHEWFERAQRVGRRPLATPAFVAMIVIHVIIRRLLLGVWVGGYGTAVHVSPSPSTLFRGVLFFPLRAFYPHIPGEYLPVSGLFRSIKTLSALGIPDKSVVVLLLAVAVVALGTAVYATKGVWMVLKHQTAEARRARQLLGYLLVGFLIALLPVLSMGQAVSLTDSEGGRLLYFPSAFSVLLTVFFINQVSARQQRAVFSAIGAIYVVALFHTNQTWHRAADLTRQILDQTMQRATGQPIVLLNVPDNLGGAYIYRNGLSSAWRMFGGSGQPPISLTTHTLQRPSDPIDVTVAQDMISIQLREPNYFRPFSLPALLSFPRPAILEQAGLKTVIQASAIPQSATLLYYSAGAIQDLRRF